MKFVRKEGLFNFISSILNRVVILALGFILPRIIIEHYGSDINGLTNTIIQIFTYLSLLEAGIGSATRNILYAHLKNDDKDSISKIMSISKRYYQKITIIYAIGVVVLSLVLPFIIKSSLNYWEILLLVFFEGITGVISFYFIQNWTCILMTDGKNYIVLLIELLFKILVFGLKIVLCLMNYNIVLVQGLPVLFVFVKLLLFWFYMRKRYGWINYNVDVKGEKLPDKSSYVITEIAWTIFSSTDLIVLSIFVSTELASVYSIYNMVFLALGNLLNAVYQGLQYKLGKAYVTDLDLYKRIHNLYNSFFMMSITILMSVCYILMNPFVELYVDGIADVDYIYRWAPLFFSIIQLLSWTRYVSGNLTGIAGYAKITSYVSLVEAILNITLSIILVNFMGIYGVLIATVVALPIKAIFTNWLADFKIMKGNWVSTVAILSVNYLIFGGAVLFEYFVPLEITNIGQFIMWGGILTVSVGIIAFALNSIANKNFFKAFIINRTFL